jgi:hypothetical protein
VSNCGLDFFTTPEALGEQTGGIADFLILHPGASLMRMDRDYYAAVGDKHGPCWREVDPSVLMDRMTEELIKTKAPEEVK